MNENLSVLRDLVWRDNEFGDLEHTLYFGDLYVGGILKIVQASRKLTPWRGWFMNDEEGNEIGWFGTPEEAREAVENRLKKAIYI